jgi:predicted DNA-binding transcriptional regulator AlpA
MEPNANNANQLDPLMTLRDAAKVIGRSVRELWREISRGNLARPVPGRPARIFESDVRNYLNHLRAERDKLPKATEEKKYD